MVVSVCFSPPWCLRGPPTQLPEAHSLDSVKYCVLCSRARCLLVFGARCLLVFVSLSLAPWRHWQQPLFLAPLVPNTCSVRVADFSWNTVLFLNLNLSCLRNFSFFAIIKVSFFSKQLFYVLGFFFLIGHKSNSLNYSTPLNILKPIVQYFNHRYTFSEPLHNHGPGLINSSGWTHCLPVTRITHASSWRLWSPRSQSAPWTQVQVCSLILSPNLGTSGNYAKATHRSMKEGSRRQKEFFTFSL